MPQLDNQTAIGFPPASFADRTDQVNLLLLANGLPVTEDFAAQALPDVSRGFLESHAEHQRLLTDYRCPADRRIEAFLAEHFAESQARAGRPGRCGCRRGRWFSPAMGLPGNLSLPANGEQFANDYLTSYRVEKRRAAQSRSDRRTTEGTFHVPKAACRSPATSGRCRSGVCGELAQGGDESADGIDDAAVFARISHSRRGHLCRCCCGRWCARRFRGFRRSGRWRFGSSRPGGLVSNLDFVESIFGNAGDPFLPKNDAGLDVEHWTGHTGCVILAPHLTQLTKKSLGLPPLSRRPNGRSATACAGKTEDESTTTASPSSSPAGRCDGVIVTLIADNYYGYCKKEVKTQISYAANLFGNVEEEHAGGAIAFATYNLGDEYVPDSRRPRGQRPDLGEVVKDYGELMDVNREGYGIDKNSPEPDLHQRRRAGIAAAAGGVLDQGRKGAAHSAGARQSLHDAGGLQDSHGEASRRPTWRIIGTAGTAHSATSPAPFPAAASREISKSLRDYMLYGPIFVADFRRDMETRGGDLRPGLLRHAGDPIQGNPGLWQAAFAADSVARALAGLGDQAAHPQLRIHRRIQPLARRRFRRTSMRWCSSSSASTGPSGARIGASNSTWTSSTASRATNSKSATASSSARISASACWPAGPGGRSSSGRISRRGQNSDRGRHLRLGGGPRAAGQFADQNICRRLPAWPHPTSSSPTASTASFSGPTMPCIAASISRPKPTCRSGDNFISNFEPLRPEAVQAMVNRVVDFEKFTPPMQDFLRKAAGEKTPLYRLLRQSAGSSTANPPKTRATCRPGPI